MSMTPQTRLYLDVEVLVDGRWWPGTLEHWRQREGVWEGWVRYSTGASETRLGWFAAEDLKQEPQGT